MTPPVFLAESLEAAEAGSRVTLEGDEAKHAARVRRIHAGERIDIVDGQGRRAISVVSEVGARSVACQIEQVIDEAPPARRIIAIQAIAKGDRSERAVETMTEIGVDVIVPWAARRSVTTWDAQRSDRGVQRWQATARAAMKQSRRAWQPVVSDPVDLAGACKIVTQARSAFLLDGAGDPLPALLTADPGSGDWVVIVGPEGGIDEGETEALESAGAVRAALGPTVLRSSTAGTIAAAIIAGRHRWSSSAVSPGEFVTGSTP